MTVNMPIVRKLLDVGDSRAMTIPKSWLEYLEKERGQKIMELAVEVDKVLIISPIFSNNMNGQKKHTREKAKQRQEAKK
jgi:antitoxin component of MazEF toxin-antitoxin module